MSKTPTLNPKQITLHLHYTLVKIVIDSFQNILRTLSIFNPNLNQQIKLPSVLNAPFLWFGLTHRRRCNTVYLHLVIEERKVTERHTSNRGHWLSLTSWKCNICHDLPKLLPRPWIAAQWKALCPVQAACTAERCTLGLYAPPPIHPVRFTTRQIGAHICFYHAVLCLYWGRVQFLSQHLNHMSLKFNSSYSFVVLRIRYHSEK